MGRILIFSGSTGGGHHQVASTLKTELEEKGHFVQISDLLTDYNKAVKFCTVDGYRFMYKHTGHLYGLLYRLSNHKFASVTVGSLFYQLTKAPLLKYIDEFSPDLIITVHPFGSGVLGKLRLKGHIHCKTLALITDYSVHGTHVGKGIDKYIVGSNVLKEKLLKLGVPSHKIASLGIPIRKDFKEKDPSVRDDGIFHVLIMGGSDGESFIRKSVYWIAKNPDIHITVVCGNNHNLYSTLQKTYKHHKYIHIKGFVEEIQPLMSKADVIITKPGAITITEAISQELPIIIPYAIPGHETANAKFLEKSGVAQRVHSSLWLAFTIERMMKNPALINKMKQNIQSDEIKYSTNDIIESIANYM